MGSGGEADIRWSQLSGFVARAMGLNYPRERWHDLRRGVGEAAAELGLADAEACADWLLAGPATDERIQLLARHLTIGETYFFRDKAAFEVLAEKVLPEVVRHRRPSGRWLRIWCAGCSTGEEPYSLSILLQQIIPDWADWHVTILGTDLNSRFLEKAALGVYGEWSFRDVPAGIRQRYFRRAGEGRYAVLPEVRKRVRFARLNLAGDAYPSAASGTDMMDVVLCRNALMYFTPDQARAAVGRLVRALVPGGWLVVSPTEGALLPCRNLSHFRGAALYQRTRESWEPEAELAEAGGGGPSAEFWGRGGGDALGGGISAVEISPAVGIGGPEERPAEALRAEPDGPAASARARALADEGKLAAALASCDQWLAEDRLNPSAHYLRAVILQERGEAEEARRALRRAIYLQPRLVPAHFALGNLARARGRMDEARKHFGHALDLLNACGSEELLPETGGLTAGRLADTIAQILEAEGAA